AANYSFDLGIERAKGSEERGKSVAKVGDDGAAMLVLANDQPPAGCSNFGQLLVILAVELGLHLSLGLVCLSRLAPYETLTFTGKALAASRLFALHKVHGSGPVAGRAPYLEVRPSLVQPRLPRRDFHRLLVLA